MQRCVGGYGKILPMLERSGCAIMAFGYPGDMTITVLWSPTALEFVWFLQFGCFDPIWWYNIV